MKTKNTFLVLLLLLTCSCIFTLEGQYMYKWDKINIPNALSFRIPPSMELRDNDGIVKKTLDDYVELLYYKHFTPSRVVVQTKGFDDIEYLATMLYGRIIVSLDFNDYRDFAEQIVLFNQSDLDEMSNYDKQQLEEEATTYGVNLKEISKTTLRSIGNKEALHFSYLRESVKDKTDVKIDVYRVFTNNYIAEITYSYRLSEAEVWKNDLEKSVETFEFK